MAWHAVALAFGIAAQACCKVADQGRDVFGQAVDQGPIERCEADQCGEPDAFMLGRIAGKFGKPLARGLASQLRQRLDSLMAQQGVLAAETLVGDQDK